MRWKFAPLAAMLTLTTAASAAELDYRTWIEGALEMWILDFASPNVTQVVLGESSTPGILQHAIRFSKDVSAEDPGTRNVVLFECGMHGREWLAAESCYWLMDYLYDNLNSPAVDALLTAADVWIIPQSNPAGRELDDLVLGDPTEYNRFCDLGPDQREPCDTDSDCAINPPGLPQPSCVDGGWRGNSNLTSCGLGVDLARNFSSGWGNAPTCATEPIKYRGTNPFSEPETLNLRRFIHNHMISTVAIQHANGEKVDNAWFNASQAITHVVIQLVIINAFGSVGYLPEPAMGRAPVGHGSGQFSAWLTTASDTVGDLDQATERNINTFFFELPVHGPIEGTMYQNFPGDGANSFHPSNTIMQSLWEDAILDMLVEIIRQTESPLCPLDASGVRLSAKCPPRDFGLVGAKIASATNQVGLLDYDPATREETLPPGLHQVVFAVQSFSGDVTKVATEATVSIARDGGAAVVTVVPVNLAAGARGVFAVPHAFASTPGQGSSTYTVSITLNGDGFLNNNTKSFAFRVRGSLKAALVGGRADAVFSEGATEVLIRSEFATRLQASPDETGVVVTLRPFHARIEGVQPNRNPLVWSLPAGSRWQRSGAGANTTWTYTAPPDQPSPVQRLVLRGEAGALTTAELRAGSPDLARFQGARAATFELTLGLNGTRLIGQAILAGATVPPPRTPPLEVDTEPCGE